MAEKVSLRQVGKEIGGKLHKGPIIDAYNRLSQPSIPTKIEQILTIPTSSEGFNISSQRFTSSTARLPGPGDYNLHTASNPSLSNKSYLMTHSSRFKKHQYATPVPGPGSYNPKSKRKAVTAIISNKGKERTASFPMGNKSIPSPGYYEPKPPLSTRETTSMFKSTSKRMPSTPGGELPAPWQYNMPKQKTSGKLTSAFVIPSTRKREQINLYDPHAKPLQVTSPGPGDYSIDVTKKDRPSSMFLSHDVDRFGKPIRTRKRDIRPGPGEYSLDKENSKSLVTGAAFASESKRGWIKTDKKPPGPAFYNPMAVPKRKSFNFKTRNIWI